MASRNEGTRTAGAQKKDWIDFQAVKAAVTMQMVLDHYGVKGLKRSGDDLRGPCPIHRGNINTKHLSVNPGKNAFKCFATSCGARGNVLDFVAAMENCSVRDAALKLGDWFKVGESPSSEPEHSEGSDGEVNVRRGIYRDEDGQLFEVIATSVAGEYFPEVVVYRELSGDYQFRVAPPSVFTGDSDAAEPQPRLFTLVKAL